VMEAWGFEYASSAVWDKGDRIGTGQIFRNQHEVLLYGKRGEMPGSQYKPGSILRYPRGEHSAKPKEVCKTIERMYPDFGASFETFTNAEFLEQETLGPMTKLAPGASVEHTERWTLHKNVHIREWDDAELDRVLLPLVAK